MATLFSYSAVWRKERIAVEKAMKLEGLTCKKCEYVKPLRTHHCSVCGNCVLLMDHHCMWTNNCIGLGNYKQFLQLNLFGQLACWYTILTISFAYADGEGVDDKLPNLYYFAKVWDLLVAKMLLALTGFNFYVASTGLTYLEFRSAMECRARELNEKFYGKVEKTGVPRQDEHRKSLLKFNYGFST